ncbi:NADP-dependent oxidoreductase [Plantactinospora sp. S1510]|uniref:NADP-dependent oxidoreductase n=2 Tax=Plantactinospora alkalitolerans TaxID=2789879 RepID=A0ABS0HAL5_9ACTN|nr:NADP-dependent oxidoreductase [Plantactinospora alkalitolerans]
MKAISQDVLGGPEVLKQVWMNRPRAGVGEILVRVHAAGVNPLDWKTRAAGLFLGRPPFILGWDVSGVVEAVGVGVTLFRPGDEVFGMPRLPHQAGAYAEYLAAPARHFARKPAGIDHVHAAALPLASLTAWQAMTETANVQPGQRVLIHGAAGGVGHVAVQIAKALGAQVIGTASGPKHTFLRKLGADELIDYTTVAFEKVASEVDVVIDPIGEDYGPRSLQLLRPGGTLVSLPHPAEDRLVPQAAERGIRAGYLLVEPDHAGLQAISDLVQSGRLRAKVGTVLPLAEAAEAHRLGQTGHTTGKIVLAVGA